MAASPCGQAGFVPGILRRNLRPAPVWPARSAPPLARAPAGGPAAATGHVFHAGFFFKVVAGSCDRVVLRESGLNNYITLPVPRAALLRGLSTACRPARRSGAEDAGSTGSRCHAP